VVSLVKSTLAAGGGPWRIANPGRVRATRWRFAFYESEDDALSSEEMAQRFGHRFIGAPRISCAAQVEA
jgi:hypothetical protein